MKMPTIEVSHRDLCRLIGKKLSIEEMKDAIMYAKGEVDSVEGDALKIDIKDTNRPDLWSAEGIARELQGRCTNRTGLPKYKIKKGKVVVKVDKRMKNVRPFTVCAVAKKLKVNDDVLAQTVQLQEKICGTFGRNRKEVALGIYDLKRIKPPIKFTTVKPDGIRFAPLEFKKKMTPAEILKEHPKGKEFGHLLAGLKDYPMFIDSRGEVLSIPPIINSNYSGKVEKGIKDIFIECSGFNLKFLIPALNVMVAALADRGAKIESVKVRYPAGYKKQKGTLITPDMSPKKASVDVDYVNKVSGLSLAGKEMCRLLEKGRHEPKLKLRGKKIEVLYPAYRQDIMHPRDLAEDVIISYGFNRIKPVPPKLPTIGDISAAEKFSDKVASIMTGIGLQEVLSYTMTNRDNLFKKMNIRPKTKAIAEIENPVSLNWDVFRTWLLPNLLEFLSHNLHVEYPQKVFEVGDVVLLDAKQETGTKNVKKLACSIADTRVSYAEVSSVLDSFMQNMGLKYELKPTTHSSFINGRVADIIAHGKKIGIIGEVHPAVLNNWKLEMPVAAFEVNLDEL